MPRSSFKDINLIPFSSNFVRREKTWNYLLEKIEVSEANGEFPLVHIGGIPGTGKTLLTGHFARELGRPIWIGVGKGMFQDEKSILIEIGLILKDFYHRPEFHQYYATNIANELPGTYRTITHRTLAKCLNQDDYVLCVDNFHLIEQQDEIIELIHSLVRLTEANRKTEQSKFKAIILVSEKKPPSALGQVIEKHLEGFGEVWQTADLVKSRLRHAEITSEQIELLHEKTEGHPGVIELFVLYLILLTNQELQKILSNMSQILVDLSEQQAIRDYLLERISDNLLPPQRKILEIISLLRQPFNLQDAWEIIKQIDRKYNFDELYLLRRQYFIKLVKDPEVGTNFYHMHSLLRDHFVHGISSGDKNHIHDLAAKYFASQEEYCRSAEHLINKGNVEEAVRILINPENRYRVYSDGNIGVYYEILSNLDEREFWNQPKLLQAIHTRKGDAHEVTSKYVSALNSYFQAMQFCAENDVLQKAELFRKLGWVYQRLAKWEDSLEMYNQGLALVESHFGDKKLDRELLLEKGRQLIQLGHVYFKQLDYARASKCCSEGMKLLDSAISNTTKEEIKKIFRYQAQGNLFWGLIHHGQGDYLDAMGRFEKAMELYKDIEDDYGICQTNLYLGMVYGAIDENLIRAKPYLSEAIKESQKLSLLKVEADCYRQKAKIEIITGNYEDAREDMWHSIEIQQQIEATGDLAWSRNTLANIHFLVGDLNKAREEWEIARKLFEGNGSTNDIVGIEANLAFLDKLRGDFKSARDIWENGLDFSRRNKDHEWELEFLISLLELDLFVDLDSARLKQKIISCKDKANNPGYRRHFIRITYLESQYHLEAGRISKSLELLNECCDEINTVFFQSYYPALLLRSEVYMLLDETDNANRALQSSMQFLSKYENLNMISGRIERARGLALIGEDLELAKNALEKSISLFENIGAPLFAAGTQYKAGRLLKHYGRREEGNRYLNRALLFFEKGKMRARVDNIHQLMID